jgi:hypothetical protein
MWPMGMQQHQSLIVHQRVDLCEELRVVVHAHVFEHADGNDAIESLVDVAIIPQVEAYAIRKSKSLGLLVGKGMLLLRQGHAGDINVLERSKVQRQIAPAAPNIKESQARLEIELMEFRVEEELAVERSICQPHGDARPWSPSKDVGPAS